MGMLCSIGMVPLLMMNLLKAILLKNLLHPLKRKQQKSQLLKKKLLQKSKSTSNKDYQQQGRVYLSPKYYLQSSTYILWYYHHALCYIIIPILLCLASFHIFTVISLKYFLAPFFGKADFTVPYKTSFH